MRYVNQRRWLAFTAAGLPGHAPRRARAGRPPRPTTVAETQLAAPRALLVAVLADVPPAATVYAFYDAVGKLASVTAEPAPVHCYVYDAVGRQTDRTAPFEARADPATSTTTDDDAPPDRPPLTSTAYSFLYDGGPPAEDTLAGPGSVSPGGAGNLLYIYDSHGPRSEP
jgi:YD repeat-containing protein